MIIDAHFHIGQVGEKGVLTPSDLNAGFMREMVRPFFSHEAEIPKTVIEGMTAEEALELEAEAGVEMVGVMSVHSMAKCPGKSEWYDRDMENDYLARMQGKYPRKIIGFGSINPWLGQGAIKEMERCINNLNLYGIKLYPTYMHYRPDNKEMMWPIYEKAEELDIPLIIHQTSTTTIDAPMEYQRPYQLDAVARDFRNLRIQVAHFGFPWVDECMVMISRHKNMYADISFWLALEQPWVILNQLLRCPGYGCSYRKLFWGTDTTLTPKANLNKFTRLNSWAKKMHLPKIPEKDIAAMLGSNFANFLRLEEKLKEN